MEPASHAVPCPPLPPAPCSKYRVAIAGKSADVDLWGRSAS